MDTNDPSASEDLPQDISSMEQSEENQISEKEQQIRSFIVDAETKMLQAIEQSNNVINEKIQNLDRRLFEAQSKMSMGNAEAQQEEQAAENTLDAAGSEAMQQADEAIQQTEATISEAINQSHEAVTAAMGQAFTDPQIAPVADPAQQVQNPIEVTEASSAGAPEWLTEMQKAEQTVSTTINQEMSPE